MLLLSKRTQSSLVSRAAATVRSFSTSVNTHEHKLSRPTSAPKPLKSWGSLIPETLREMDTDSEFKLTSSRLQQLGQKKLTLEEKKRLRRSLNNLDIPSFDTFIRDMGLKRSLATVLQLNIGLYCNQACNHCHVESSPKRTESMSEAVAAKCLDIIRQSPSIKTLDITGGAPELNPQFRSLVTAASSLGIQIIDRCNLTVLEEPGQEDLANFLALHNVRVVASLPCYSSKNVDTQRGKGVFERSIRGLQRLNAVGYGSSSLNLDLVYNPLGAFLPPSQEDLEVKYKDELKQSFGIEFNNLFTLANMPIKRFADFLYRRNELDEYMNLLFNSFNRETIPGLMCTDHVSVGYDGRIYDCDFNQQLQISSKEGLSVFDIKDVSELLLDTEIATSNHCYGCTAGNGSSCQGTTTTTTS